MKSIFCILMVLLLLSACGYPDKIEVKKPEWNDKLAGMTSKEEKWSDEFASFTLRVYEGTVGIPFVAQLTINNHTDRTLTFPLPMIMTLCGETNKNCIRVYDKNGKKLEMHGFHLDFLKTPLAEIPGNSKETWHFVLDKRFPQMKKPGEFSVEFWYYSVKADKATWIGQVDMKRITVIRKVALKKKETTMQEEK